MVFFYRLRENIINIFLRVIFILPNLKIILQNRSDLNYLIKKTGLKKNKVKIIKGSGVDLKKFKFSRINYKFPKILMASRIIEDKGVFDYIKAIQHLKKKNISAKFYLIGDIDEANPSAIQKKNIENWIKNKLVNYFEHQQNIEKFIKNSSIVVLPSYREGFPKILMEAAAIGRPVITTNVPGCRDAVIENETGILVPVKNYIALAKAIEKLSKDKKKLKKIGIAARKHAIKNFNIIDIVSQHISIYKKIV
jgi:glycosyltransferase involved in cell wall biosynthesis